ncbi:ABC transporter permease [Lagierella sp.]|uniref:ABC transporter permease n=1 Tax=Lagierella sp. TaxID=2849657 RepID=UPI00261FD860|nr:ABC transporter permease [Lagierella sp.]
MRLNDLLIFSLRNLGRRKLRTILTVLSILIGTSFIILMLSFGLGMQRSNEELIESMGGLTNITVRSDQNYYYGGNSQNNKAKELNEAKLKTFEAMDKVRAVFPVIEVMDGNLMVKNHSTYAPIKGVDINKMEEFGYQIQEGKNITQNSDLEFVYANVEFFDERTGVPIENIDLMKEKPTLRIGYQDMSAEIETGEKTYMDFNLKPIGKMTGGDMYMPEIFVNYKTAKKLYMESMKLNLYGEEKPKKISEKDIPYSYVMVKAKELEDVKPLQDEFNEMGYFTQSNLEFNESMQEQVKIVQKVFGAIGAVALLVAAIGIANTMIMSIYERTREIGIMKVVGASIKNIRDIFLIESTLVGFIGGILGIAFSCLVSFLLNKYLFKTGLDPSEGGMGMSSYIPIWLMGVSALFSALIGLLSGLLPAIRATKISAIDAIRTE